MAGYSGTPLPKKLGIQGNVALINAPDGFARSLGVEEKALVRSLRKASAAISEDGNHWIAWPKKSSGVASNLTENRLREIILPTGLVDNKVCAIDEIWSGLRFCKRRKDRK